MFVRFATRKSWQGIQGKDNAPTPFRRDVAVNRSLATEGRWTLFANTGLPDCG
jgi:hypothetical protein